MTDFNGFSHGMGIGGWLTNYKRFNVLPNDKRMDITVGDLEHFDEYITENDVSYIASLGMDHIRLGFDQIVVEQSPYVYRERVMKKIDEFVSWCENATLNVVLNLHKALGNYCDIKEDVSLLDSKEYQDRFVAMWEYFEDRYSHKPKIVFELLNEVRGGIDHDKWNDLAERTIKAIRAKNKTRRIIIGGTDWNNPPALPFVRVYDDENVIYTFHMYAPFEFTHQQGVLQQPCCYYNRKMPYPCDIERYRDFHKVVYGNENAYMGFERMDKKVLLHKLQPVFDFIKAHPDKVLWCGEFGTIRHCKTEYRENWMADMISILKENGIPYCVWNYLSTPNDGNRFSLVDDEDRKIVSPRMAEIIRGNV